MDVYANVRADVVYNGANETFGNPALDTMRWVPSARFDMVGTWRVKGTRFLLQE